MTRYEHTQIGHVIIWSLLAIILIASGELVGPSFHREPPVIVSIILPVCLVLFYKLRITIEDETLCVSFGLGIIRKRVQLTEIVGCEPIRIRWWYGWGIHLTPWRSRCAMAENLPLALMILTGSPRQSEPRFRECTLR